MATQAHLGSRKAIRLNLREAQPFREDALAQPPDALRPALDQALALIADCVAACGETENPIGIIEDCRVALFSADSPVGLCLTGLDACRQFLARHDAIGPERRHQMIELVELVREAMTALADDAEIFDHGLSASAARFDAMLKLDSLSDIKTQLAREVGELKRVTAARHESWDATLSGFSAKIADLETRLAESEQQATADPLTGLANRAAFDRTLNELTSEPGSRFVLALVDVDDFKSVNDTYGHLAGDQVLIAVAASMRTAFRGDDVIARHGGDEFAVLIKDATLYQAEHRVCAVLDSAVENRPMTDDGTSIVFTLSVGLAEFSAGDTTRSLQLRADKALYDAKRHGKNRVVHREPAYLRDLRQK